MNNDIIELIIAMQNKPKENKRKTILTKNHINH